VLTDLVWRRERKGAYSANDGEGLLLVVELIGEALMRYGTYRPRIPVASTFSFGSAVEHRGYVVKGKYEHAYLVRAAHVTSRLTGSKSSTPHASSRGTMASSRR
jgi:hypothetical protein